MISVVSNSYYGILIHINKPPEHPIMSYETIEIKMAAIFAKRSVKVTFYGMYNDTWRMQPFSSQSQQFSRGRFVISESMLLLVRTRMIEFVVSLCYSYLFRSFLWAVKLD